jgi:hypothetical protein
MSKLIVNEIEKYDAGQLTITTGTNVSIGSDLTVGGALGGTLSTAAQPNVTSVGTLTSLAVSGTSALNNTLTITGPNVGNSSLIVRNADNANSGEILLGGTTFGSKIIRDSIGADQDLLLVNSHGTPQGFKFRTGATTAGTTDLMVITGAGNVGIGTATIQQSDAGRTVTTINGTTSAILNLATGDVLRSYYYVDSSGSTLETSGTNTISASGANIIAFNTNSSERVRIDSSGNVGIGTSSPQASGGYGVLQLNGSTGGVVKFSDDDTLVSQIYGSDVSLNVQAEGARNVVIRTNGSEKMRIDSDGNVLIGGTSSTGAAGSGSGRGNLFLAGSTSNKIIFNNNSTTVNGYLYSDSSELQISSGSGYMNFQAGGSERMRILSGGEVCVGKTAAIGTVEGIILYQEGQIYRTADGVQTDVMNRLNSDGKILIFQKDSVEVGFISTNTNSLPSDLNFKKNISDLELGLEFVSKLRPVSYNHKIDDEDTALSTGFIAQELEQSLIELGVEKNKYHILQHQPTEDENQSQYWVDYSKMIPVLTNAIKELKARIETLENK